VSWSRAYFPSLSRSVLTPPTVHHIELNGLARPSEQHRVRWAPRQSPAPATPTTLLLDRRSGDTGTAPGGGAGASRLGRPALTAFMPPPRRPTAPPAGRRHPGPAPPRIGAVREGGGLPSHVRDPADPVPHRSVAAAGPRARARVYTTRCSLQRYTGTVALLRGRELHRSVVQRLWTIDACGAAMI
jgi:hypothetical protein